MYSLHYRAHKPKSTLNYFNKTEIRRELEQMPRRKESKRLGKSRDLWMS